MAGVEINDFSAPDEVRRPDHTHRRGRQDRRRRDRPIHVPARLALVRAHQARRRHRLVPDRARRLPGVRHAGRRADDGTTGEVTPGCVYRIAPGHDGWVVGDEPVVVVEFQGAATYAKA